MQFLFILFSNLLHFAFLYAIVVLVQPHLQCDEGQFPTAQLDSHHPFIPGCWSYGGMATQPPEGGFGFSVGGIGVAGPGPSVGTGGRGGRV